jgi:hypothetical protein
MDTTQNVSVSVPQIDASHYFSQFIHFFSNNAGHFSGGAESFIGVVIALCIPAIIFFMVAIVITVEGIKKIRHIEDERYNQPEKKEEVVSKVDQDLARRWKKVLEHVDSPNPNDWKQAIIEADVMLDNLVTKLGYRGESLGEKLKRSVRGDFKTRDMAWDAHMVRNRIAHDGSAYELNQVEAKRVISLYRQVFDEFYHISG